MEDEQGRTETDPGKQARHVYLNHGVLKVVLVVEDKNQNSELLGSFFEHMSEWFSENAEHLVMAPELDGASWRLHEAIIHTSTDPAQSNELPEITDPGDTFPEDWLS